MQNSSYPSLEEYPEPRRPRTLQDFKAAVDYMLLYANYDRMIQEDIKFRTPEIQEAIVTDAATNMLQTDVKMDQDGDGDDEEEEGDDYETHDSGENFFD